MATTAFPTRDDFAAMLDESLGGADGGFEGRVVKGTVTAIENDLAVIDVGLKSEGRVPLREFAMPGQKADLNVGDEVEVYVDRVENANGEAMLSRDRARREAAWDKLEERIQQGSPRRGRHLRPRQGRLHRRSRRRRGVPARFAGRYPPGARCRPADGHAAALPDSQDGSPPRQHRRVAPRHPGRNPRRTAFGPDPDLAEGQIIEGVVKNITDYGAFVDLGGIDGLLHVTDMSYKRVNHPSEMINIGDTVKRPDHPHQQGHPAHQPRHEAA
jgi:small subunit ribosomal protein S1